MRKTVKKVRKVEKRKKGGDKQKMETRVNGKVTVSQGHFQTEKKFQKMVETLGETAAKFVIGHGKRGKSGKVEIKKEETVSKAKVKKQAKQVVTEQKLPVDLTTEAVKKQVKGKKVYKRFEKKAEEDKIHVVKVSEKLVVSKELTALFGKVGASLKDGCKVEKGVLRVPAKKGTVVLSGYRRVGKNTGKRQLLAIKFAREGKDGTRKHLKQWLPGNAKVALVVEKVKKVR